MALSETIPQADAPSIFSLQSGPRKKTKGAANGPEIQSALMGPRSIGFWVHFLSCVALR